MVPRFRQVIVERPGKPLDVAYIGEDSEKAEAIFDAECANASNLAVRLFIYPAQNRLRYPFEEAEQRKEMDVIAARQAEAKARAIGEEATRAQELAEKKIAEAQAAWKDLDPSTRERLEKEFTAAEEAKAKAKADAQDAADAKVRADAEATLKRLQAEAVAVAAAAAEASKKLAEATGQPEPDSSTLAPAGGEGATAPIDVKAKAKGKRP